MSTGQIEKILRQAPCPIPPPGLRDAIVDSALSQLPSPGVEKPNTVPIREPAQQFRTNGLLPWLRRWWSVLIPGGATLVCVGIMAAQQSQLRELRHPTLETTAHPIKVYESVKPASDTAPVDPAEVLTKQESEIARLLTLVTQLTEEVAALEQEANERGRATLAPGQDYLNADELAFLEQAQARAQRIQCVNNLKQIGLGTRIWANDNGDVLPDSLLTLSNELVTPKILVCPADTSRQPATDWNIINAANCSYEYLAASAATADPERVMTRCPIHNNVGMVDGSVQMIESGRLNYIDGKLYLKAAGGPATQPAPANAPTAPPSAEQQSREALMKRYGLTPEQAPPEFE